MKNLFLTIIIFITSFSIAWPQSILVEAESFSQLGGWVIDQQFIASMGSPYLLAHGMGEAVENASTTVIFPEKGNYHYWVCTKDWVPDRPESPGKFKLIINGKEQKQVFGTNTFGWQWVYGGKTKIGDTSVKLELKDLTGFEGRCDAIYFSVDRYDYPPKMMGENSKWRLEKLALPPAKLAGKYDLVVVGGGISGSCCAVAAARLGLSVALINDRPVLGGNASSEIRVPLRGLPFYTIVEELSELCPKGDDRIFLKEDNIRQVIESENKIHLFLNTYVNEVIKSDNKIVAIAGMNTKSSERIQFAGNYFVDATGDGWLGYYAGARYMMGREAKSEFNESMAPGKADEMTMGSSVLWTSYVADIPSIFPDVPWAMNVAKDYNAKRGEWNWEYGMTLNTIYDAEEIRDHMFRAIYGTWANVKADPKNANLKLKWVAYIAGKRESRRLLGEYILKEEDVINHINFEDGFVEEKREIDIHYPKPGEYDFLAYAEHSPKIEQYKIPYRCLISKDIPNLFMVGRCFSATHVALGSARIMHTGGQMGVVVGSAAFVCSRNNCLPSDVYKNYLNELKKVLQPLIIK